MLVVEVVVLTLDRAVLVVQEAAAQVVQLTQTVLLELPILEVVGVVLAAVITLLG
jgi:hypothetical protein